MFEYVQSKPFVSFSETPLAPGDLIWLHGDIAAADHAFATSVIRGALGLSAAPAPRPTGRLVVDVETIDMGTTSYPDWGFAYRVTVHRWGSPQPRFTNAGTYMLTSGDIGGGPQRPQSEYDDIRRRRSITRFLRRADVRTTWATIPADSVLPAGTQVLTRRGEVVQIDAITSQFDGGIVAYDPTSVSPIGAEHKGHEMYNTITVTKSVDSAIKRVPHQRRPAADHVLFLGGDDVEMRLIAETARSAGATVVDGKLPWGAKASDYARLLDRLAEAATLGIPHKVPVLVELELDRDVPAGAIIIDHHGARAHEPASILQICELLSVQATRWHRLVAAHDAEWYAGLIRLAATPDEMARIAAIDAECRGLTAERIAEIDRAMSAPVEMAGGTRVVRMAHSKTGPVGDRIAMAAIAAGAKSPADFPAYIVVSDDGEINYSGDGMMAAHLHRLFPGGWAGGAGLGDAGGGAYWGSTSADAADVLSILSALLPEDVAHYAAHGAA
ncbi:hypothetical protein P7L78_22150 [Tistrella bauzanensis]|uniref:hypothetical protein n=1 Tax=Tistrella TaxID=171436 RepID=UPI0031F6D5A5